MTARRIRLIVASALMLLLCSVTACNGAISRDSGAEARIRVGVSEDIDNLMIGKLHTMGDRFIALNVYDGLLQYKPGTTKVEPALATRYSLSDDGLEWRFKLREGVEFSGGYGEMTSRDVKATFDYQMDPDNATYDSSLFSAIDSIETPDDYTVVVRLSSPNPSMRYSIFAWQPGYITSADALEDLGPDGLAKQPVGTGPYMLKESLRGEGTTLDVNSEYFGEAPKNGGLDFRVVPDQRVAVESVKSGEIDVTSVSQSSSYRVLQEAEEADEAVGVQAKVSSWNDFLYFNTARSPLDKVKVRRAVAHAIDLKALHRSIGDIVSDNPSYFSKAVPEWTDDVTTYEPSQNEVDRLVDEAGYDSPEDVSLTLAYSKANLYEDLTLRTADMLREAGFDVEVETVPREQQADFAQGSDWDLYVWAAGRVSPDDYGSNYTRSDGASNYTKWSNPKADALIDRAREEVDDDKRADLYAQLQKFVKRELPLLTLDTMESLLATAPNVDGVVPSGAYAGVARLDSVRRG